jgi:hypothetical protein
MLAVWLGACGSSELAPAAPSADSPPPRLDRSGTRLQLRGYEADGIFVREGLYDTKLALKCVPRVASDGVERCVPRDVLPLGPYADGADAGPDYMDATCSTPLVTIAKAMCADPARILVRSSAGFGGRDGESYWHIGAPTTPAKIYPASFGKCSESAPSPAFDYYERGAPLAPTEMVAFVRGDVAISPTLHAVVLEGEDGSRLQAERDFIDVARNKPCEIAFAEDGISRCTPLSARLYQERMFVDASCQKAAATSAIDCSRALCDDSTVSALVGATTSGACLPERHRFYAAGPRVATGDVHFGSGPAECGASIKQSSTIVEVGASIEPAVFPAILPGRAAVQSRLEERTRLVGGVPIGQSALFDPQIDDECRFEKAADGKIRCLPAQAIGSTPGFADAACTTPVFSPAASCQPAPKHARIVEGPACDPVVRILAVIPATHAYERRDGVCVEAPLLPETFVGGAELPATTFVEAVPATR